MKVLSITVAVTSLCGAGAFAPQQQKPCSTTSLQAERDWCAPIAAAALGWTLASQAATAFVPSNEQVLAGNAVASTSAVVAALETKPAPTYESLDFSLPKYGSSTASGFGEGTEAFLSGGGPNASSERQKQEEAMKKAAAARKAQLEAKKQEEQLRREEDKRRSIEKQKEADARVKALFSGKDNV
eukprot:CAMPEP_0197442806 /NCGR_PEP_ID=MMETSP1175-20131217/8740_1 /TAXON_ID=1003142 /ORGANISM="Triceratium dubium, Strain CCMP147" /LENGTH=184 /DNA_ID=CAMNT_0042973347 /DNA_START=165 /DNA_END=719 /DNA_ORIENTATION=-